jgi:hypothetical protein
MQGYAQNIGEVLLFGWQPLYLPKIWQNSPVFGLLPTFFFFFWQLKKFH